MHGLIPLHLGAASGFIYESEAASLLPSDSGCSCSHRGAAEWQSWGVQQEWWSGLHQGLGALLLFAGVTGGLMDGVRQQSLQDVGGGRALTWTLWSARLLIQPTSELVFEWFVFNFSKSTLALAVVFFFSYVSVVTWLLSINDELLRKQTFTYPTSLLGYRAGLWWRPDGRSWILETRSLFSKTWQKMTWQTMRCSVRQIRASVCFFFLYDIWNQGSDLYSELKSTPGIMRNF